MQITDSTSNPRSISRVFTCGVLWNILVTIRCALVFFVQQNSGSLPLTVKHVAFGVKDDSAHWDPTLPENRRVFFEVRLVVFDYKLIIPMRIFAGSIVLYVNSGAPSSSTNSKYWILQKNVFYACLN